MTETSTPRWLRWPDGPSHPRIGFGADYNPDQWSREVWDEDVRLMRQAGVNIVSLAIFSWARIQPTEDSWDFAWLDEVIDLLHANGIAVDLATATASPPPWLSRRHPEILPVTHRGETLWPGGRQHWRPTSPVFREYALRLVTALAERYAEHPAIAAWHVNNELGCHNVYDYSDDAARAFRGWLRDRYRSLDALNHAWGTAFWSQRYSDWEEILPPRQGAAQSNPTQQLDFTRFSSDALKDYLRAEREILRRITPGIPVTTNFMVMSGTKPMDYASWADEVDFVSNDHYIVPREQSFDELSFSANLTSNIAGGRPWFLMEHSTSAVNWQPVNLPKKPGQMIRDSLTHVAHGADAVCFFQWRQSAAGAEKYHSAMVPHAGEDSAVYRSVTELGRTLEALAPVVGSERKASPVAILFDWDSWWASEQDSHPTEQLRYHQEALDWYSALLALGVRADVVPTGRDLSGYDLVVAPILHVMPESLAQRLIRYVDGGGHLVTTYFSGIVDENDHAWLGGYPGPLRDLLGVRIEEFAPLLPDETVALGTGASGSTWTERVEVRDPATKVLASYASGDHAGWPALTRRAVGPGSATYVSTRLGAAGIRPLLSELLASAGVSSELTRDVAGRVELVIRTDGAEEFWFLINRTTETVRVTGVAGGVVASPNAAADDGSDTVTLEPHGVVVIRRPVSDTRGESTG
ncbi:beta-galactosidase [Phytoactinopolyspora halotolerans]|uniref:Beta-galactosidase n=1 Tax=Phytoactinopolyspora halotolerans TaxID=1981512 RepID=A0A6L9SI31_9ACTN|nr:beta-galactosidase [Phytoactinopolyspora halotolerans]NEE04294.1 beta-galactosidase [Phytoactinopolyspora halotolerans]